MAWSKDNGRAAKLAAEEALAQAQRAESGADYIAEVTPKIAEFVGEQTNLQTQLNDLVLQSGTDIAEVVQARGGEATLNERLNKTTAQLADMAISVSYFGVVGDGLTDDTLNMQKAIDYAIANQLALTAKPSQTFIVSGLVINGFLHLQGTFNFKAKENNQEYVLYIKSKVEFNANVDVNGNYFALYGIKAEKFGRSNFQRTNVSRVKVWGFQYNNVGNNNFVRHGYLNATLCGKKHTTPITQQTATANVNTSTAGYGTFTIGIPLNIEYTNPYSIYFIIHNNEAYKVKVVTSNTIEIYNLATEDGGLLNIDIICGGGLNIITYGDNGVGSFDGLDIGSNYGIGLHASSLYGHVFNNLVCQGNSIGFGCERYMLSTSFIKPYFEINGIDFVVHEYIEGYLTESVMDISKIQRTTGRVSGHLFSADRLKINDYQGYGMISYSIPSSNPTTITLNPGEAQAFARSAGAWNFKINNNIKFDILKQYVIMLDLKNTVAIKDLNISLVVANGQTIEGSSTFSTTVYSKSVLLKIFKVGLDWKITIIDTEPLNTVSIVPKRIGLVSVVSGKAYISIGTTSTADWKQITNPDAV